MKDSNDSHKVFEVVEEQPDDDGPGSEIDIESEVGVGGSVGATLREP